ncbi:MAG: Hsp20/alpha crystallin family protein [Candidatus Binatia bacterium]
MADPSGTRQLTSPVTAPYRRDPFSVMRELLQWDPRDAAVLPAWEAPGFVPSFDVKETKDGLIIEADLPGMTEADVHVSLAGNRLTISGERRPEPKKEDENYLVLERAYGAFSRTFILPGDVDADHAKAS